MGPVKTGYVGSVRPISISTDSTFSSQQFGSHYKVFMTCDSQSRLLLVSFLITQVLHIIGNYQQNSQKPVENWIVTTIQHIVM